MRQLRVRLEPVAIERHDVRPIALRARDYTGLSLKAYVDCLQDKKASHTDKIRAATEILNRGYGKAVENVHITNLNAFAGLSDGDIAATLADIRAAIAVRTRSDAATDITQSASIIDGVGGVSGLQAGEASPPADGQVAESGGEQE